MCTVGSLATARTVLANWDIPATAAAAVATAATTTTTTTTTTTRVGTLIVATIYLQLIQNRSCFEVLLSFNVVTSIVYNPLPAMWKS